MSSRQLLIAVMLFISSAVIVAKWPSPREGNEHRAADVIRLIDANRRAFSNDLKKLDEIYHQGADPLAIEEHIDSASLESVIEMLKFGIEDRYALLALERVANATDDSEISRLLSHLPNGTQRAFLWHSFIEVVAENDPIKALDLGIEKPFSLDASSVVWDIWAKNDPIGASAAARERLASPSVMARLAETWMESDFPAAAGWIRNLPERDDVLTSLVASGSFATLDELIQIKSVDDRWSARIWDAVIEEFGESEADELITICFDSGKQSDFMREYVISQLSQNIAVGMESGEIQELAWELPGLNSRHQLLKHWAMARASEEPLNVCQEIVNTMADDGNAKHALVGAATRWALTDPKAARSFIEQELSSKPYGNPSFDIRQK